MRYCGILAFIATANLFIRILIESSSISLLKKNQLSGVHFLLQQHGRRSVMIQNIPFTKMLLLTVSQSWENIIPNSMRNHVSCSHSVKIFYLFLSIFNLTNKISKCFIPTTSLLILNLHGVDQMSKLWKLLQEILMRRTGKMRQGRLSRGR